MPPQRETPGPIGPSESSKKTKTLGGVSVANGSGIARQTVDTVYRYVDSDDQTLFEVVRKPGKRFVQRRPDGHGGRIYDLEDVKRVPYRLPDLEVADADQTVFVCEGEKDADRLASNGVLATTSAGGAAWPWTLEWVETHFSGRLQIVVLADNDEPGRRCANQRAETLSQVVRDVRVIEFGETVEHGDVSDWLDAGHTIEELYERVEAASPWRPSELLPENISRLKSNILRGDEIESIPPPQYLIDQWLTLDSTTILYGPSGVGKSFVTIDWALSAATGSWWFGHRVDRCRVLYVIAEGASGVNKRVKAWKKARQTHNIEEAFWLPITVNLMNAEELQELKDLVDDVCPSFVIIDTLARSMVGGDENSARDMGVVLDACEDVRRASGACVLLVHHTGKDDAAGPRGSSSLFGGVETVIKAKGNDEHALTLHLEKQKNGPDGLREDLCLRVVGDSCVVDRRSSQEPSMFNEVTPNQRTVLRVLHEIDQGEGVSNTVWRDTARDEGVTPSTFHRAIRSLLDSHHVSSAGSRTQKRYTLSELGKRELGVSGVIEVSPGVIPTPIGVALTSTPLQGGSSDTSASPEIATVENLFATDVESVQS